MGVWVGLGGPTSVIMVVVVVSDVSGVDSSKTDTLLAFHKSFSQSQSVTLAGPEGLSPSYAPCRITGFSTRKEQTLGRALHNLVVSAADHPHPKPPCDTCNIAYILRVLRAVWLVHYSTSTALSMRCYAMPCALRCTTLPNLSHNK